MTSTGDDFCTAGKGVSPQHCGCMEPPRLSECAVAAAELIEKCKQLPQKATVRGFVRYAGLDTDDVCACYQKYKNEPNDSNSADLCSTLWEHVQPDKERPDSETVGGVLVIIDFQEYVVLVNKQETSMPQMTEIMSHLKNFIDMYQQYSTTSDISKLLDRL
jgi:hypothetical protein